MKVEVGWGRSFNAVAGEGIKNLERPEYQRLKPIRIEPKYGGIGIFRRPPL